MGFVILVAATSMGVTLDGSIMLDESNKTV